MSKKKFYIKDHFPKNESQVYQTNEKSELSRNNDTEIIIQRIEEAQVDITTSYIDWRDIGFAFSEEFGETGREYYHRVSRFYSKYNAGKCNKQYDECLKGRRQGINIQTFFYKAKAAGIDISSKKSIISTHYPKVNQESKKELVEEKTIFDTPQLPDSIFENLPLFLKECTELFTDSTEKDVFLIGAIAVLSGCLPNITGKYWNETYTAHLYALITAPAASKKGTMKWAKHLGYKIHQSLREASNNETEAYELEIENYNNLSKKEKQDSEKPKKPPKRMLYFPANSSSSVIIQALGENDFHGIIFETEADTLSNILAQDWGNFSDILRKAFHHESTSMYRRKDDEFIEITDPHLAIALSGTPKQVVKLMPDAENGLFSRFIYYAFEDESDFINPFKTKDTINFHDFFNQKGSVIKDLHEQLKVLQNPVYFKFSEQQGESFTALFKDMLDRNKLLLGNDFNANIKRLGLITFRIAMVLSALRILEEGELPMHINCSDIDFKNSLEIASILEKHAIAVYKMLPQIEPAGIKQKFFQKLPEEFNRQDYLKVAAELDIKDKTAQNYLSQFRKAGLLAHDHDKYTKVNK